MSMIAAANSNFDLCEFLLKRQGKIDVVDNQGQNVLHYAIKGVNMTLIKWIFDLMKHDINFVNKQDVEGTTPYVLACKGEEYAQSQHIAEFIGSQPEVDITIPDKSNVHGHEYLRKHRVSNVMC